ncbi:AAA family ATPase [Lihuaxuella thermophila]|uniref:Predicted ATPase n=1 Tax=Lihuaxuella thermophila TaxID=1173111 RepID=A0A1H8AVG0_9BACL|nr:AAA family ATPase [Lihuaxuella thermophila]SEM74675.1 Predicted ATPase [Lihuaxuella thermophila]
MIIERVSCEINSKNKNEWPFNVPAVAQIVEEELTFTAPITFLVGENGSGKSTIVEAIAEAYGLDAHGGRAGRKYVNDRPKTPLGEVLQLHYTPIGLTRSISPRNRKGYFLRAETAFGFMSFVSGMPGYWKEDITEMSHGEGFLTVLDTMFSEPGLYLMDEPEAALSFSSCLRLIAIIHRLASIGGQVICATHSPLLTAIPGSEILELDQKGIRQVSWRELSLVDHWRRYLNDPSFYLRHILEED